jgi:hypothetical protein
MSRAKRPLAFLVVFVVGYFLLLLGLALAYLLLIGIGASPDFLSLVGALAGVASAAAIIAGGYIAFRQLGEVANARHLDVADRLFDELNLDENIAARRWVFLNLPEDPKEGMPALTPEGQEAVKRVLNTLDRVAFLTQAGWIPDDLIMPWMHPMIAKSWEKLEPYVLFERQRRNEPYYYEKASQLAERCHAWRQKHLEDVQVRWLKDAL